MPSTFARALLVVCCFALSGCFGASALPGSVAAAVESAPATTSPPPGASPTTMPTPTAAPAPTIEAIDPTVGRVGTRIRLTGRNFGTGMTIKIGGAPCATVAVVDAATATCDAPLVSPAKHDVVVTNADGQSDEIKTALEIVSNLYLDGLTNDSAIVYATRIDGATGDLEVIGGTTFASGFQTYAINLAQVQPPPRFTRTGNLMVYGMSSKTALLRLDEKTGKLGKTTMSGSAHTPYPGGTPVGRTFLNELNYNATVIPGTSRVISLTNMMWATGNLHQDVGFGINDLSMDGNSLGLQLGDTLMYDVYGNTEFNGAGGAVGSGDRLGSRNLLADPTGKFVYTARGSLRVYPLGAKNTTVATAQKIGAGIDTLVATTDMKFIYGFYAKQTVEVSTASKTVAGYRRDATTGMLTAVPGSPYDLGNVYELTMHPSNRYLYVLTANEVRLHAVANDGAIATTAAATFPIAGEPVQAKTDATGTFLYVVTRAGLKAFRIDAADGKLTALTIKTTGLPAQPSNLSAY